MPPTAKSWTRSSRGSGLSISPTVSPPSRRFPAMTFPRMALWTVLPASSLNRPPICAARSRRPWLLVPAISPVRRPMPTRTMQRRPLESALEPELESAVVTGASPPLRPDLPVVVVVFLAAVAAAATAPVPVARGPAAIGSKQVWDASHRAVVVVVAVAPPPVRCFFFGVQWRGRGEHPARRCGSKRSG